MAETHSIQSREGAKRVFYWFLLQRGILERGITTKPNLNDLVRKVSIPLIESIADSCTSLEPLYEGNKIRDTYAISRCILETIINVAFIQAEGEKVADRMLKHAIQKRIRDFKREIKIGKAGITLVRQNSPEPQQQTKEILAEFTTRNGREVTFWCNETINQRLESIQRKFGEKISIQMAFATFAIYRTASEVLHGTLFSLMDVHETRHSPKQANHNIATKFTMIFLMLGSAMQGLSEILIKNGTFKNLESEISKAEEVFKTINAK